MSKDISIKNGAKLDLIGLASKVIEFAKDSTTHAIYPDYFFNLKPRMILKKVDKVKGGSPIFHDKNDERIVIVAPVSGYIQSIDRGEKRKILKVLISKDGDDKIDYQINESQRLNKTDIISLLLKSGSWSFIRQRP